MSDTEKLFRAKALSYDGKTVCYDINDPSKYLFVPGLVPGETAFLDTSKVIPSIKKIVEISEERVPPPSKIFEQCGGCDLQFMSINKQRDEKISLIKHTLENYFNVKFLAYYNQSDQLPSYHYRTRTNLHRRKKLLGFFSKKSNSIVSFEECLILNKKISQFIKDNNYFSALSDEIEGITLELVNDEVLVAYKNKNNMVINTHSHPVGSFFQVNPAANNKLIEILLAQTWGEKIIEFYAGAGNFSFKLKKPGHKIIAIEADYSLVQLATQQTDSDNPKFICCSTEKYIKTHALNGDILLDPPRSGAKELCQHLDPIKNPLVVYVSCSINTLGRDLQILVKKSYQPSELHFIDMFPQTRHIECVAILKKVAV